MDLMAMIGQLDSKLGGDHTASTIRGITRDSDFHSRVRSISGIGCARRVCGPKKWGGATRSLLDQPARAVKVHAAFIGVNLI